MSCVIAIDNIKGWCSYHDITQWFLKYCFDDAFSLLLYCKAADVMKKKESHYETTNSNYYQLLDKMWQNVKMISYWTWSLLPKITLHRLNFLSSMIQTKSNSAGKCLKRPFSRRLLGQLHIGLEVYHSFCHPVESRFKALPLWLQYSALEAAAILYTVEWLHCVFIQILRSMQTLGGSCVKKNRQFHTQKLQKRNWWQDKTHWALWHSRSQAAAPFLHKFRSLTLDG